MQITWVNHASFVANIDGVRLISDPWIEGSAFDNGWSLLSKSKFGFHDFRDIQYVFFPHEHPDQLQPTKPPVHTGRVSPKHYSALS
jgi:L-ascorbate metabolism protein UlaG (beta-lactamase superfamily)